MLTGREQETAFLENHYKRPGSQILVVYGQRGVGKTALLTAFAEKKQTIRYTAPNCSSREMCYQWGQELREQGKEISRNPSWEEVLQCVSGEKSDRKKVLIIENFHYLLKGDTFFFTGIDPLSERTQGAFSSCNSYDLCIRMGGEQYDL